MDTPNFHEIMIGKTPMRIVSFERGINLPYDITVLHVDGSRLILTTPRMRFAVDCLAQEKAMELLAKIQLAAEQYDSAFYLPTYEISVYFAVR